MRNKLLILGIFLVWLVFWAQPVNATVIPNYTSNNPDEDGYIHYDGVTYTRNTALADPYCAADPLSATWDRGYIQFPTTSIPDNATILSVTLAITISQVNAPANWDFNPIITKPSTAADADLYADIADGASYFSDYVVVGTDQAMTYNLGNTTTDAACVDLQSHLATNWFAVGIISLDSPVTWSWFHAEESATPPVLTVRYSYMGFTYDFNAKYEDNTDINLNVTALDADGVASTFNIPSGTTVSYGFTERPSYFTWNVTASYYRRIYIISDTGDFTFTVPESSFGVFTPIIRDFTHATSGGGAYFTTNRTIGGVNTLIERVPIVTLVNGIPCTLTVNRIYTLGVDTAVTDYSWSFYSTTAMPSPILLIDVLRFDEVLQFNTRYIHITADRPTSTSVRFNYTDDLLHTQNVTMNFKLRNGTTVFTHTINATNSFSYTWGAATNTTEYTAEALIIHSDFGNLTYTRSFLGVTTYSTPPSLTGLGSFGGIDMSQVMGAIIILGIAGLFSAKNATGGLLVCALVAAILSYIHWFTISTGVIIFVIFIAIAFEMGRSRN